MRYYNMNEDYKQKYKNFQIKLQKEKERRYPSLLIPDSIPKELLNWKNSPYKQDNLKFGQHFLFQIVNKNTMTYPQIGLFIEYDIADQALEYKYVLEPRRFEYKIDKYFHPNTIIDSHYEWDDSIFIFKVWDKKPTWKKIKKEMYNTFYFYRQGKIKSLLED